MSDLRRVEAEARWRRAELLVQSGDIEQAIHEIAIVYEIFVSYGDPRMVEVHRRWMGLYNHLVDLMQGEEEAPNENVTLQEKTFDDPSLNEIDVVDGEQAHQALPTEFESDIVIDEEVHVDDMASSEMLGDSEEDNEDNEESFSVDVDTWNSQENQPAVTEDTSVLMNPVIAQPPSPPSSHDFSSILTDSLADDPFALSTSVSTTSMFQETNTPSLGRVSTPQVSQTLMHAVANSVTTEQSRAPWEISKNNTPPPVYLSSPAHAIPQLEVVKASVHTKTVATTLSQRIATPALVEMVPTISGKIIDDSPFAGVQDIQSMRVSTEPTKVIVGTVVVNQAVQHRRAKLEMLLSRIQKNRSKALG